MKFIKQISILFLLITSSVLPHNYIVAESNGDFTTIQEAVNVAVAGDTIFVREKTTPYFEKVEFVRSGNETDGYITLTAYLNEHPIIDGTGVNLGSDWIVGLIEIINKNYISVEDFEIRNLITSDGNKFPAGIWVRGSSSHIKIKNNIIHNIIHNNADAGAHGLAFYGTSSSQPMNDLLIEGNEIYSCVLAWSESLVLNGNVEDFIVKNNVVHDNDNIAFDFIGFEGTCSNEEFDQARNGYVADNIAYNIDSRSNPAYDGEGSADGFYVDGGKNILFERNLAYNCNIGFELASEHFNKATSGIVIRDNFIANNNAMGISIGGYDSQRGKTINCSIINNTIYHNRNSGFDWGAEINIGYYCSGNRYENNIVVSTSTNPIISLENTTCDNFIFSHNLYFSDGNPTWVWENHYYYDFASYVAGSSNDEGSLYSNPIFDEDALANNSPKILTGSPAIDAGVNIDTSLTGSYDFAGNNRIVNNIIDIGAIEFNNPNGISENCSSVRNFILYPAYPNPFKIKDNSAKSSSITIKFIANKSEFGKKIDVDIYNLEGLKIKRLFSGAVNKKEFLFTWDGKDSLNNYVATGVYFLTLKSVENVLTEKILILK